MTATKTPLHILVIGGYGEFGGRLAQLLIRDGHNVSVAGRDINKATIFCNTFGGNPVKLDIHTDLHLLSSLKPNVVVDAAGPFQQYGHDNERYRVAKQALSQGAHYLDLSDDGTFTRDISSLDEFAKQRHLFALSGASTTPAITGAAVAYCREQLDSIEKIETSILPGSRAPQGRSVMLAILDQVGNPIPFWRQGAWENHNGWSNPVRKKVHHFSRQANLISTADVVLFPEHFKAKSVLFRAGLEITIMHKSLQWLGSIRAAGYLPNLIAFISPMRWIANLITPLGKDNGGMLVEVVGETRIKENTIVEGTIEEDISVVFTECQWTLAAAQGQGPFVPAIPARALIRHIETIPPGARAVIEELPLAAYVQAMDDLAISTSFNHAELSRPCRHALGDQWRTLPKTVRNSHRVIDQLQLNGLATITRGSSWMTQLVALIFRFPPEGDHIPVQVSKTRLGESEIWIRDFNGQRFKSVLEGVKSKPHALTTGLITEQFGLLKFRLKLQAIDDAMHFNVVSASIFGIPIPSVFLPISNSREFEKNDTMHFCVELLAPFNIGLIVRYEGWLK